MDIEADYSAYTLPQLFKARYWVETRGKSLEEEIQKRCSHIRERASDKAPVGAGPHRRFRPYGLRFGVVSLFFSIGPFAAIKFLDAINILHDAGDIQTLTGVWAFLTLPAVLVVFTIGATGDAERVVEWFNLDGRHNF